MFPFMASFSGIVTLPKDAHEAENETASINVPKSQKVKNVAASKPTTEKSALKSLKKKLPYLSSSPPGTPSGSLRKRCNRLPPLPNNSELLVDKSKPITDEQVIPNSVLEKIVDDVLGTPVEAIPNSLLEKIVEDVISTPEETTHKKSRKNVAQSKKNKKSAVKPKSVEKPQPLSKQMAVEKIEEIIPQETPFTKVRPFNFLTPEYTKSEMRYMSKLSTFLLPYDYIIRIGYPFLIENKNGEEGNYVCFHTSYGRNKFEPALTPFTEESSSDNSSIGSDNSFPSSDGSNSELMMPCMEPVPNQYNCGRCKNKFSFTNNDRCFYHTGKLTKNTDFQIYTCCDRHRSLPGCVSSLEHVWSGIYPGLNGPFADYRITEPSYRYKHRLIALDCEMCYTYNGLELSRVTVLDLRGEVIYDTLVKPSSPIIDFNTRFSGITKEMFDNAENVASLEEVQNNLLELIDCYTIIVGHGLENDLRALKMVHFTIIDTAVILFRQEDHRGYLKRHSLKNICKRILNKNIQDERGHDSIEDARSCLELLSNVTASWEIN